MAGSVYGPDSRSSKTEKLKTFPDPNKEHFVKWD